MFRSLLALVLLAAPCAARAEWHEASSNHFTVYSDDTPEGIKEFATKLERFDRALRYLRKMPDEKLAKASRVTVYMVSDSKALTKLTGNDWIAGFYRGAAGDSLAFVPRKGQDTSGWSRQEIEAALGAQAILLHEYTHHFLLSLSPNVAYPAWFVEGYSEFFAPSEFEPDGSIVVGRPPLYRAWSLLSDHSLTVGRMLTVDWPKLSGAERYATYAHGWLLTHYLFLGGKRDGQLGAYFRALNDGKPGAEAVKVFGDLGDLQGELWRYKRSNFIGTRIDVSVLPVGEVKVRKLGAGEAALMPVRLQTKAGVNEKRAAIVYAAAKAAAAPWPNDLAAQLALSEAAFDAKDHAGAEAAADRAIAADPKSVEALLDKARARIETARAAGDKAPATWTAIRKLIATANRIDTENPAPLRLYYQTYVASGQTPPEPAVQGLLYAYVLAPQDRDLRLEAAGAHLRGGNPDQARVLLTALATDPHGSGRGSIAARALAALDAGKPDQAIVEVDTRADPAPDKKKSKK